MVLTNTTLNLIGGSTSSTNRGITFNGLTTINLSNNVTFAGTVAFGGTTDINVDANKSVTFSGPIAALNSNYLYKDGSGASP